MLCFIPHIHKDDFENFDVNHMKQVKNVIKTLFRGISYKYINITLETF